MQIPNVFLDTSALFAGIWSEKSGARMLLKLGEAQTAKVSVSSHVLTEIEGAVRHKAPKSLVVLALLLDRSRIILTASGSEAQIDTCQSFVAYRPDAIVLAAAWAAEVDYFVTLDRKHFLKNQQLLDATPFEVGTPGDCLEWLKYTLTSSG